jgi:acyl-coenzyme A thioesterase PaaI-like protein
MDSSVAAVAHDPVALTAALHASAPLIGTLNIEVIEVGDPIRVRIPNDVGSRNHMSGPHAGAIFTLGETTAACLILTQLGDLLDQAVALAVSAEIQWTKLAQCAVIAEASLPVDADVIRQEFLSGGRPEWTTEVNFTREDDGAPCARMSVVLTLVRPR